MKDNSSKPAANYRSIFISDVHLGTKDCKAEQLNQFLKSHRCESLYIVGDFIDGWRMAKKVFWKKSFTRVIRRILKMSKHGVKIYYIAGNHDEFLRKFANNRFDTIQLINKITHVTADKQKLLVMHGDQFDGVTRAHKILKWIGDWGYDLLMFLNRQFNYVRAKYGYGYWSFAGFLKTHIKRAQMHISDYEDVAALYAAKQGFDGIICGHIHHAAMKQLHNVSYYNTGDWVESCTALAENFDGSFALIDWKNLEKESKISGKSSHLALELNLLSNQSVKILAEDSLEPTNSQICVKTESKNKTAKQLETA